MKKASLISILLMTTILMVPTFAEAATETWVAMHGRITSYGLTPMALGWCGVHAKVGEWARVRAFWVPMIPQHPPEPPFTFSFYAAKLVNASIVELTYGGNDFYVFGLWDVFSVTFEYYGEYNFTITVTPLADNAEGELTVPNLLPGESFTIDITGVELIAGEVRFVCLRSIEIPMGDCSGPTPGMADRRVDIRDLVHVAKAYGSTPGMLHFDFSMDFDFDFRVGLCELTTIAANLGKEY